MIPYYAYLEEITHYEKKVLDERETVAITTNKNKRYYEWTLRHHYK